jgi:hypothetical protein
VLQYGSRGDDQQAASCEGATNSRYGGKRERLEAWKSIAEIVELLAGAAHLVTGSSKVQSTWTRPMRPSPVHLCVKWGALAASDGRPASWKTQWPRLRRRRRICRRGHRRKNRHRVSW